MEELKVKGMMCKGCESRVKNALSELSEIKKAEANHKDGTVKFESNEKLDINRVIETIEELGYEVEKR